MRSTHAAGGKQGEREAAPRSLSHRAALRRAPGTAPGDGQRGAENDADRAPPRTGPHPALSSACTGNSIACPWPRDDARKSELVHHLPLAGGGGALAAHTVITADGDQPSSRFVPFALSGASMIFSGASYTSRCSARAEGSARRAGDRAGRRALNEHRRVQPLPGTLSPRSARGRRAVAAPLAPRARARRVVAAGAPRAAPRPPPPRSASASRPSAARRSRAAVASFSERARRGARRTQGAARPRGGVLTIVPPASSAATPRATWRSALAVPCAALGSRALGAPAPARGAGARGRGGDRAAEARVLGRALAAVLGLAAYVLAVDPRAGRPRRRRARRRARGRGRRASWRRARERRGRGRARGRAAAGRAFAQRGRARARGAAAAARLRAPRFYLLFGAGAAPAGAGLAVSNNLAQIAAAAGAPAGAARAARRALLSTPRG